MKTLNKLMSILLALVLVLAIAGCGQGAEEVTKETAASGETSTEEGGTVESAAAVNPDELEHVELVWYTIGDGPQPGADEVNALISEYTTEKINASIRMEILSWGDYPERLPVMSATGEEFDLCFTSHWANPFRVQAARGAFVPLNDPNDNYFEKYLPKTYELTGQYINDTMIDGAAYAIPTNKEMALDAIFVYRKDIVEEYGIDMSTVTSFADLDPILATIKENEPDMVPLDVIDWSVLDMSIPDQPLGSVPEIVVIEEDGRLVPKLSYDLPEMQEQYAIINDYYNKGYIREDVVAVDDNFADLSVGRSFIIPQSGKPGKDGEQSAQFNLELAQVSISEPVIQTNNITGSMIAISSTSKNPERAAMFIELLNTDKYLNNLVNFGIEGVHYDKVDENIIKLKSDVPEAQSYAISGTAWSRQNQFLNYIIEGEDPAKWDNFKAFNEEGTLSPMFGFVFDVTPVTNEEAALASVSEKWEESFNRGVLSLDEYYDEAMAEYKTAGLDVLMAEIQSQLDAWVASK